MVNMKMSDTTNPQQPVSTFKSSTRLILAAVAVAAILLASTGIADRAGLQFIENGMKRTLVTFGIARTLNGVISVAQGTEVAFEPAGIGVNLTPGEILDPVNDMIERFSWVMLSASASLGLQRLVIEFFEWLPLTLLYVAVALFLLIALFSPVSGRLKRFAVRLFLVASIIRFLIPALAFGAELIHDGFLEPKYESAMATLSQSSEAIGGEKSESTPVEESADEGLISKFKRIYGGAQESLNVDSRLERFKEVAGEITTSVVELIVIFLFQALLLPLAAIWGAQYVFRSLMRFLSPQQAVYSSN